KGFYGERVHRAVLEYGAKVTGATIHYCDEQYDTGPVILQHAIDVREDDTPATLAERVAAVEHELYPRAIQLHAEGRLVIEGRRVRTAPGARGGARPPAWMKRVSTPLASRPILRHGDARRRAGLGQACAGGRRRPADSRADARCARPGRLPRRHRGVRARGALPPG